jgi:hypothetical protein
MVWIGGYSAGRADEPGDRFVDLTRDGEAHATIVAPEDKDSVWADAIAKLTKTCSQWGGIAPHVVRLAKDAPLPNGDLIVIGTPDTSNALAALATTASEVGRLGFGDRHAFAIESHAMNGTKRLFIAGRTPRGAFNGAVFCRDFLLDASSNSDGKADVFVRSAKLTRSPRIAVRGTYTLPLYGVAMRYTADDWMRIVDRHAEDGMNRLYFWLSGHHPSKKYPRLFDVDATKGTRLTVEGVARLIKYCHDRGIEFYIGGGVFAWTAADRLMVDHPELAASKTGGLCPSKPLARLGNREHFLEMYETWPEADGFMFEVRDEHGECQCSECQTPIDSFGSKNYGRQEIGWLQEFARAAWARNPGLRFAWLIGYREHERDVNYYDEIRRMTDPRFEWIDARVGLDLKGPWTLPGPGSVKHPLAFFSPRISHWDQFYKEPAERILRAAARIADDGLNGYTPAFEPGFSTPSYYSDEIPYPVDRLPYVLTGFVYREATWDPALTVEELKQRIHHRFFSADAPRRFADDLLYLHQFCLDHALAISTFAKPRYGFGGETIANPTVAGELQRVGAISDKTDRVVQSAALETTFRQLASAGEHLARMAEIEKAMNETAASPKTRDGFAIMRRLIDDTRMFYQKAVPDPRMLSERRR